MESYISFKLKDSKFSAPVSKILEILEVPKITKIPNTADYVLGVINLRGEAIPTIDLREILEVEKSESTVNTSIIVFEIPIKDKLTKIGGLVDSVNNVFDVEDSEIKPYNHLRSNPNISGTILEGDTINMILNVDYLLENVLN